MKLDINCIRDVLLSLEEHLVLDENLKYNDLTIQSLYSKGDLEQYTLQDVAYTVSILEEAGFIDGSIKLINKQIYFSSITSLTFEGHQFLDSIRPTPIWKKVCEVSLKTGAKSFSAIMKIVELVLPEVLAYSLNSI